MEDRIIKGVGIYNRTPPFLVTGGSPDRTDSDTAAGCVYTLGEVEEDNRLAEASVVRPPKDLE
jgi:hypothetical protein